MVAIRTTGGAVFAATFTTLTGWAALLISGHRGLISMGVLACFGMGSTLLVSLTVLPALLQLFQQRKAANAAPAEAAPEPAREASA